MKISIRYSHLSVKLTGVVFGLGLNLASAMRTNTSTNSSKPMDALVGGAKRELCPACGYAATLPEREALSALTVSMCECEYVHVWVTGRYVSDGYMRNGSLSIIFTMGAAIAN